ncbi:MAG: antibiotic biosynthesis monooxygenase [Actinomycetes bacterium]
MDPDGADAAGAEDGPVTAVLSRRVRPGRAAEFETWVAGITGALTSFPGSLGVTVLRPAELERDEWLLVLRFASAEDLAAWRTSDVRARWLADVDDLVVGDLGWQERTGLEAWFTLQGRPVPGGPPPRWKQAVLTTIGLVPLLLLSNATLGAALAAAGVGPVLRVLLVTPLLVAAMFWVVMPRVTAVAQRWLYPDVAPAADSRRRSALR